jgi:hypothetical protein
MINFIIKYSTCQNNDEKFMIYFFNMPYVVLYDFAKFELKSAFVYREIKMTNCVKG